MKKYTLPRHTVLGKHGYRIVAAVVDIAITFAYFLVLFFAGTNLIFGFTITGSMRSQLYDYKVDSGLYYVKDNTVTFYQKSSDADYRVFDTVLRYYFLNYLTGVEPTTLPYEDVKVYLPETFVAAPNYLEPIKVDGEDVLAKDFYTPSWYNTYVLEIPDDPEAETSTSLFTYVKDGDEYNKNIVGVLRETRYDETKKEQVNITETEVRSFFYNQYASARENLMKQSFYSMLDFKLSFFTGLAVYIAAMMAFFFSYILVPLIRKDGATFGKMIMHLGLAEIHGYTHRRYQILLRAIPFVLTLSVICFIPFVDIYILSLIGLVMMLVSFALLMASPKRTTLHDFTAQTIVVDTKSSILFETRADEVAYIYEEDGILPTSEDENN